MYIYEFECGCSLPLSPDMFMYKGIIHCEEHKQPMSKLIFKCNLCQSTHEVKRRRNNKIYCDDCDKKLLPTCVYSCGCQLQVRIGRYPRTCKLHVNSKLVNIIHRCRKCSKEFYKDINHSSSKYCHDCCELIPDISRTRKIDSSFRNDGSRTDCKYYNYCISDAGIRNLNKLKCKDCNRYIYKGIDILDYL